MSPIQRAFTIASTLAMAVLTTSVLTTSARAQDAALVTAAKQEGKLVWYTTQIVNQFARPAADAFEKKYGIKVDFIRADSNDVVLRLLNENKAGKVQADVFDGTAAVAALKKENMVLQWVPDRARELPADLHDKDNYWVATNLYVLTPGFNTDLVQRGTEPKTFQDLLDPKWKGKLAWSDAATSSGAGGFTGLVLTTMGDEKGRAYLKQLATQNVAGLQVAARQVLDQVIAGEYAIALNIFNNHAVISAAKGAPSAWIPMSPALADFSVVSVTKAATHPNAGKLFVDFLFSPEGQTLFQQADYLPVDPAVPPKDPSLRPDGKTFTAKYFTPEELAENMPGWAAVYQQIFR